MLSAQTSPKRTFKKLRAVAHTCNLSTQAVGIGNPRGLLALNNKLQPIRNPVSKKQNGWHPGDPKLT